MLSLTYRSAAVPFILACFILAAQESQAPHTLNLLIIQGEGAINNVKLRTARETVVQVEDENHKPVAAVVVFLLPGNGPGGAFADGSKSATVVADQYGRAVMPRLNLNAASGRYEIRVHASYQGLEADAIILQSTIAAAGGLSTGVIVGIVAAVAGAAAVGIVLGTRGKGNGSSSSTPTPASPTPTGTIGVGSGATIGPPR